MGEKTLIDQALLLQTLERCGADPARWPDDTRAGLEALVAKDPSARATRDEFAALDQLITDAGATTGGLSAAGNTALAEKIMLSIAGSTAATARSQPEGETVVPFKPAGFVEAGRQRAQQTKLGTKRATRIWPDVAAVGALAASLLLGISIGASGVANSTLAPVSEVLGLGPIATETAALSDPIFDAIDAPSFDDDVL